MNENSKNIKIIIISVLSCFVLIIIGAIIGTLTSQKPLNFYNIDQIDSGLPSAEISDLENYIWEYMQDNQGYDDSKIGIRALIRPSSFGEFVKDDVTSYDFLVDIDEYQITYKVSFSFLNDEGFYESPEIVCPAPSQMKYPDTICVGREANAYTTDGTTFLNELPYYFDLPTGQFVTVTLESPYDERDYLNVRVSSCGDNAIIESARSEVKSWIESFGYSPDDYDIRIEEFCDGSV